MSEKKTITIIAIGFLFLVLAIWVIISNLYQRNLDNLEIEARRDFIEWFGVGGNIELDLDLPISEDLFDPTVFYLAQDWQENGIADHLGMDSDDIDYLIEYLQIHGYLEEEVADVQALLTGGFPILGDVGSDYLFDDHPFDAGRFLRAVTAIDDNAGLDRSVLGTWSVLIRGGD